MLSDLWQEQRDKNQTQFVTGLIIAEQMVKEPAQRRAR